MDQKLEEKNVNEFYVILERAQKGDEVAVSLLIDAVQNRLFRYCFYMTNNYELAEDLCQEAFIKILKNLKSLKKKEGFLPWAFQISKNLYIDSKRRKSSTETLVTEEEVEQIPSEQKNRDLIIDFNKALSKLDLSERLLVILVGVEGYSYLEAANVIGVTEDSLRLRLHRVKKELEKVFLEKLETKDEDETS
ncbi:MAG: RNA polymerase sigma factor [bacterium]